MGKKTSGRMHSRTMMILAQYFTNKMAVFCASLIAVLILMAISTAIEFQFGHRARGCGS